MRYYRPHRPYHCRSSDIGLCHHSGCQEKGEYPAPRSRHALAEYIYFCLDHVRLYNKNWNYYEGMSSAQIDADRYSDSIRESNDSTLVRSDITIEGLGDEDDLGLHYNDYAHYGESTILALNILMPPLPITLETIKRTYKQWAKKLHPDLNACSDAENKLKEINEAYTLLKLAFCDNSN